MSPILYVIRHGETEWNRLGRLQGQTDTPLNDTGRAQAGEAGRRLAKVVDAGRLPHLHFAASPLRRASETMTLLRAELGLLPADAFARDARLRELCFGRWEGLTWAQVRTDHPGDAAARSRNIWDFAPPEGESYAQLGERLDAWLGERTGDTAFVTHGGVIRALMVIRAGVPAHEAGRFDVPQGRVMVLDDGRVTWV